MPRTPRAQWPALFNPFGSGIVHMEAFLGALVSADNPTLFEAIAAYLLLYGTHANRPTATNVPLQALYFETDTQNLFQNQAGTWTQIASIGGGGSAPDIQVNGASITDQTTPNFQDTATVTWSNPSAGVIEATATGSGAGGTLGGAKVHRTTTQSIPNTTTTAISFDAEDYDTDGYWTAGSPTVFTIPADGLYLVSMSAAFTATNANQGSAIIRLNGSTFTPARSSHAMMTGGNATFYNVTTVMELSNGDTLEACLFQANGGALNTDVNTGSTPYFMIERLR